MLEGLNLFAFNEIILVVTLLGPVQSGSCRWVTRIETIWSVLKRKKEGRKFMLLKQMCSLAFKES